MLIPRVRVDIRVIFVVKSSSEHVMAMFVDSLRMQGGGEGGVRVMVKVMGKVMVMLTVRVSYA